jgi:predicted PurR-regulated permease PerM
MMTVAAPARESEMVPMPLGKRHERVLGIAALILLALGCALVLWPFMTALLWAAVLCSSTWPIYSAYERTLGGHRGLAAALMTLSVALVLVAPFAILIVTLAESVSGLVATLGRIVEQGPPAPPKWVEDIPVVGDSLAAYWQSLALNAPAFATALGKLTGPATDVALASGTLLGSGLLEIGLSVFIAFFFYLHGRQMASYVRESAKRIAGARARHLLVLVGSTVKGVIYGLIGTALAQGLLAALGLWIAGVPQALLLGFLTFILSFLPAGPPLVWGSVALWLILQGEMWWGIFVALWGALLVSTIDNLLRPYLLAQSNDLPVVLGLFGLVGGILAFGFIGIFLGPVLLAVGYSLFLEWSAAAGREREDGTG